MTSDEIRSKVAEGNVSNPPLYETYWLKEIALQLAIMNERGALSKPTPPLNSPPNDVRANER